MTKDKDKIIQNLQKELMEITKAAGKLAKENQDLKEKLKKLKSHK